MGKPKKAVNRNIKVSSFKSSANIQKTEGGSDRSVPNNKFSSVTLNEVALEARQSILLFHVFKRQSIQRLI